MACIPAWTASAAEAQENLSAARANFKTHLISKVSDPEPPEPPPAGKLELVSYPSAIGPLRAYATPAPADSAARQPALIWIFGGFSNGIGDIAWRPRPATNDQSGSIFRNKGIYVFYPSFRGGSGNPGNIENFYGEVDDLLAAAAYVSSRPFVDPKRIYLGGHSTGGTLALLAAESTNVFRAVFSFGPVGDVRGYGQDQLVFDVENSREANLRNPGKWLTSIKCPTFVFEGTAEPSNIDELMLMQKLSRNPLVHFHPLKGHNHFSGLAPVSKVIAAKIAEDKEPTASISFADPDLQIPK